MCDEPLIPSEAGHNRRVPALEELELLPMSTKANLCRAEIIALVLYTGPMVRFSVVGVLSSGVLMFLCLFSLWSTTQF